MNRPFICLPCSHKSLSVFAGPVWPVYLLSAVVAPPAAGRVWCAAPGSAPVASLCLPTSGTHQIIHKCTAAQIKTWQTLAERDPVITFTYMHTFRTYIVGNISWTFVHLIMSGVDNSWLIKVNENVAHSVDKYFFHVLFSVYLVLDGSASEQLL